jgi:hypothetical protein
MHLVAGSGRYSPEPKLSGSHGTYGEQATYAAILLPEKLPGGRAVMEHYEDEALNDAIDELIVQMARVEPDLLQVEAREEIVRTVEDLLREVGTVDPPTPRF